ncbi:MAG: hypothetical protein ACI4UM_09805 [Succinivibrio sp.]
MSFITESKLLYTTALFGFLSIFGIFLTSCACVRKMDTSLNVNDKELARVFELASLAPSGHNTQMWLVNLDEDEHKAVINIDKSRRLSVVDHNMRESFISLGAYIKALSLSFSAFGYDCDTKITADGAIITYSKSRKHKDDEKMIALIEKRHTEKRPFTVKTLDETTLFILKDRFKNVSFITSKDRIFTDVQSDVKNAIVRQCMDIKAKEELSKWLRLSDREANAHKDGLNAEQLGLSGIVKYAFYMISSHESVKGKMFENQSIKIASNQVDSANAFVIVQSADDSNRSLIECGMELYDLMLALTDNGISIQPISAILEDPLSRTALTDKLHSNQNIQMIMRIGYVDGDYGKNNRFRRDLKSYISVGSTDK